MHIRKVRYNSKTFEVIWADIMFLICLRFGSQIYENWGSYLDEWRLIRQSCCAFLIAKKWILKEPKYYYSITNPQLLVFTIYSVNNHPDHHIFLKVLQHRGLNWIQYLCAQTLLKHHAWFHKPKACFSCQDIHMYSKLITKEKTHPSQLH